MYKTITLYLFLFLILPAAIYAQCTVNPGSIYYSNNSTSCGGTLPVYTIGNNAAATISGGGTLVYRWEKFTMAAGWVVLSNSNRVDWPLNTYFSENQKYRRGATCNNFANVAYSNEIVFTLTANPAANAGPDQIRCGTTSTTLAGSAIFNGTGTWTIVSGQGGVLPAPLIANAPFYGVAGTSYVLRYTVNNTCGTSSDDVNVSFPLNPVSSAGPDQNLCGVTSTTLAGNTLSGGSGTWTFVSGHQGYISQPNSPNSPYYSGYGKTTTLRWTTTNSCGSAYDDVVVSFYQPVTANAGTDQSICATNTTTLAATPPTVGTGMWTVISGHQGQVVNPTSPTSQYASAAGTSSVLRWTVTNGSCTSTDDVTITFPLAPTANAGADQLICENYAYMSAANPPSGSGLWTVVSGSATIDQPTNRYTQIYDIYNPVTLRWTVTNSCGAVYDDVTINTSGGGTISYSGSTTGCGSVYITTINSTSLPQGVIFDYTWQKYIPSTGWDYIPAYTSTLTYNQSITQTTKFRRVASCDGFETLWYSNEITFTVNAAVVANAGADQSLCGTITTTLAATPATVGTGMWTFVSGQAGQVVNPTSPTSQYTGYAGTSSVLRWTVTNGSCTSSDDVTISFTPQPVANAGTDQLICENYTYMAATNPTSGSGLWTVVSGSATIDQPSNKNTQVSGITNPVTLRWTVTNSCDLVYDDVVINTSGGGTISYAGATTGCGTINITTINSATLPQGSTFDYTWQKFTTSTGWNYISVYTNSLTLNQNITESTKYRRLASCDGFNTIWYSNEITFTVNPIAIANAGADQTLCGVTATALSANTPTSGTGVWTIVSGHQGYISNPTSPNSNYYSGYGLTTTLRWTVTNSCGSVYDDVVVGFNQNIGANISAPKDTICYNSGAGTLTTTATGTGTFNYQWYKNHVIVVGATSSTYSPGALTATTTFSCMVSASTSCPSYTVYKTIVVLPELTATVTPAESFICAGTSPGMLTANPTGGNGKYTYEWYHAGSNTGITTKTYTPVNMTTTAGIWARVYSAGCDYEITIPIAMVNVTPIPGQPGSISGLSDFVPGDQGLQYQVATVANATSYTWQYSGTGATLIGTGRAITANYNETATSGNLTVSAVNNCGSSNTSVKALVPVRRLNLSSVFLEGLLAGNGVMNRARNASGYQFPINVADEVTIELRDAANYGNVVFSVSNVQLSTSGDASIRIPFNLNSSYYVTIKHRNHIEITTNAPVSLSNNNTNRSFATPQSVYGNNLVLKFGNYAIYSGDTNNDGMIDLDDMNNAERDAALMLLGYLVTDLNGDGVVDLTDMNMAAINATRMAIKIIPQIVPQP